MAEVLALVGLMVFGMVAHHQQSLQLPQHAELASVIERHSRFDVVEYQTQLADTAWNTSGVDIIWVDKRAPFFDMKMQLLLHTQNATSGCNLMLVSLTEMVATMLRMAPNCSVFAATIDIDTPSVQCNHMLRFNAIGNGFHWSRYGLFARSREIVPQCAPHDVYSAESIQANLSRIACSKNGPYLEWKLKTLRSNTPIFRFFCPDVNNQTTLTEIFHTITQSAVLKVQCVMYIPEPHVLVIYCERK